MKSPIAIQFQLVLQAMELIDIARTKCVSKAWMNAAEEATWFHLLRISHFDGVRTAMKRCLTGPLNPRFCLNYDNTSDSFVPARHVMQFDANEQHRKNQCFAIDPWTSRLAKRIGDTFDDHHQRYMWSRKMDALLLRMRNGDLTLIPMVMFATTKQLGLSPPGLVFDRVTMDWVVDLLTLSDGQTAPVERFLSDCCIASSSLLPTLHEQSIDETNVPMARICRPWSVFEILLRRCVARSLCMQLYTLSTPRKSPLLDALSLRFPQLVASPTSFMGRLPDNSVTYMLNKWILINNAPNWTRRTGIRLDLTPLQSSDPFVSLIGAVPSPRVNVDCGHVGYQVDFYNGDGDDRIFHRKRVKPFFSATAPTLGEFCDLLEDVVTFFLAVMWGTTVGGYSAGEEELEDGALDLSASHPFAGDWSMPTDVRVALLRVPMLRVAASKKNQLAQPSRRPSALRAAPWDALVWLADLQTAYTKEVSRLTWSLSQFIHSELAPQIGVLHPDDDEALLTSVVNELLMSLVEKKSSGGGGVYPNQLVSKWTTEDCTEWFQQLGVLSPIVLDRPLTGASIGHVRQHHLNKAGVRPGKRRREILFEVQKLLKRRVARPSLKSALFALVKAVTSTIVFNGVVTSQLAYASAKNPLVCLVSLRLTRLDCFAALVRQKLTVAFTRVAPLPMELLQIRRQLSAHGFNVDE